MQKLKYYGWQHFHSFYKDHIQMTVLLCTALFIGSILLFSVLLGNNAGLATKLLIRIDPNISTLLSFHGILPTLIKNLFTGFYLIALGIIPFLYIPAIFTVFNGSLIGILFGATSYTNISHSMILVNILPHGIVFIPTIILSAACGIYVCKTISNRILHKQHIHLCKDLLPLMLRTYFLIIAPLMIVSTLIEVFITPLIIALI